MTPASPTSPGWQPEDLVDPRLAEVAVDQHHPLAGLGDGHGQVGRQRGLAVAGVRAGHLDHLVAAALGAEVQGVRTPRYASASADFGRWCDDQHRVDRPVGPAGRGGAAMRTGMWPITGSPSRRRISAGDRKLLSVTSARYAEPAPGRSPSGHGHEQALEQDRGHLAPAPGGLIGRASYRPGLLGQGELLRVSSRSVSRFRSRVPAVPASTVSSCCRPSTSCTSSGLLQGLLQELRSGSPIASISLLHRLDVEVRQFVGGLPGGRAAGAPSSGPRSAWRTSITCGWSLAHVLSSSLLPLLQGLQRVVGRVAPAAGCRAACPRLLRQVAQEDLRSWFSRLAFSTCFSRFSSSIFLSSRSCFFPSLSVTRDFRSAGDVWVLALIRPRACDELPFCLLQLVVDLSPGRP